MLLNAEKRKITKSNEKCVAPVFDVDDENEINANKTEKSCAVYVCVREPNDEEMLLLLSETKKITNGDKKMK